MTVEGEEEESFFVGDGSITTWDDFETAMLGLFTPEYLEELNINITVLEDGTTRRYVHFADHQGQLAFTAGARGSNPAYLGPDTFELISRTEDEIRFYLDRHIPCRGGERGGRAGLDRRDHPGKV